MKRKILGAALAAFASLAFGATTLPPSMINPAGSTVGQAILSTGSTGQPVWGAVPLTGITGTLAITNGGTGATTAADARTNLGLGTAATANTGTSGATVPLLSTANTWTLAQAFTVRPTFNGATPWDSSNLASPASTASPTFTGTVTTAALTATGLITPSTTSGIKGTTAADSANAGSVGEYPTPTTCSAVSLTTGVAANCTSLSLTAGDWDVSGVVIFSAAATTVMATQVAGISTTSATVGVVGSYAGIQGTQQAGTASPVATPTVRVNVSTTTTVYLIGYTNFSTSTATMAGFLRARRVR